MISYKWQSKLNILNTLFEYSETSISNILIIQFNFFPIGLSKILFYHLGGGIPAPPRGSASDLNLD